MRRINSTDIIVGIGILPQTQLKSLTSQPSTNSLPEPSVKNGNNSPTEIIIGIAILLLVLRPVMLKQKQAPKKKPPSMKK